jgi:DNA invertase Pin-like site-specific DNA recombinase
MLDPLRAGSVVMVWTLDRLSRSLEDRPRRLARIEASGAGFRSLAERIGTTTPAREAAIWKNEFHLVVAEISTEARLLVSIHLISLYAETADGSCTYKPVLGL